MKVLNTSPRQKNTRGNWKIKSAYTTNKLTASPTGRAHSRRVKYTKSNIKICMNISHRTCDQNIKCIWPPQLAVYRSGSILNTILSRKTYNYYEQSIGFKYSIQKKIQNWRKLKSDELTGKQNYLFRRDLSQRNPSFCYSL